MSTGYVITWNSNPAPELVNNYNVYRRSGQSNNYTFIATAAGNTFNPSDYLQGKKTGFRVTALNANGEGDPSSTVTINKK